MIRRPPRSTPLYSSAASDVYKRQEEQGVDDEAGAVPTGHRMLADLAAQVLDRGHDVVPGRDGVNDLDQLHDRGRVEEVHTDHVARALGRHGALDDRQRGGGRGQDRARPADLVEALEQPALFENLDEICKPGAILATTTSSLPVIECAVTTKRPGDVVGMHFFNPAPIMKLVEVVHTVSTGDDVVATVQDLCRKVGKHPVTCGDRAGFIVNALLFPYLNDAVKMLEAHYASAD